MEANAVQTLPANALVGANAAQVVPAAPGFAERLAALPAGRKWALGLGLAALIGIVVAMTMWSRQADYKVLFANLSDKDGGAILAQLSQMNVPYKHADGGAAILVPADKVHDVRLKLAQAGLPKGGTVGFELMDTARFGTTQFQERLNFQRGLEGELVRSISGLAAVESARVHLALPQQNGFFREQQKPSASVVLTLHPGRTLDRAQLAGIVHLISSSVPELSPKSVSVLDQTGALLAGADEAMAAQGLDEKQLQYVAQIESNYTKRVIDLLEPVLGRDNLRAQVTAEVDFSQTEATAEEYKPNQGNDAQPAVRSQSVSEATNAGTATPTGVPGATSNQPPTPAAAPVNGQNPPLQPAQNGANGGGSKRDAVTNYEVDKTVRVIRGATGTVKRLNAAVVVNHRTSTDAKGKTTTAPLPQEEIDKLTALVQEAVGFSKDRGDSVKVINAPFRVEKPVVEEVPLWKQPEVQDLLRTFAAPAALSLLALIVVFGAIRPALKAASTPPPPSPDKRLDAVVDDAEVLPGIENRTADGGVQALPAPEDASARKLEDARRLAKENPAAMAMLVRSWVNKEEAV